MSNSNRYPLYSYDRNSEINESSLSILKVAGCYHWRTSETQPVRFKPGLQEVNKAKRSR